VLEEAVGSILARGATLTSWCNALRGSLGHMSFSGPTVVGQSSQPPAPPLSQQASTTASATSSPRKRSRRPPPVAVPERPPTSLPVSFYPIQSSDGSHPRDAGEHNRVDSHVAGRVSAHSRKGIARRVNEDRFSVLVPERNHCGAGHVRCQAHLEAPAVYGVYDGHGGMHAADFAMTAIPELLACSNPHQEPIQRRLTKAFHGIDADICSRCSQAPILGTTACVAVVLPAGLECSSQRRQVRTLHVAHVGDSRALLVSSGPSGSSAAFLTSDHSPLRADESDRINAAGGHILNSRVNGILAVTRALGDVGLKQAVVSTPDVVSIPLLPHNHYLVLATDGIWNVCSEVDVCSLLDAVSALEVPKASVCEVAVSVTTAASREHSEQHAVTLRRAAEALADLAVSRGSTDDIAVVVVDLISYHG
jgi:protein phosphatase PTC1